MNQQTTAFKRCPKCGQVAHPMAGVCADCGHRFTAPPQGQQGPPPRVVGPALPVARAKPLSPLVSWWLVVGAGIVIAGIILLAGLVKQAEREADARAHAKQEREWVEQLKADRARAVPSTGRIYAQPRDARGPKPEPSSWDGITREVNTYLKATLRDYESMKIVECSIVAPFGDYAWAQRVKYRARNGFGGMNLEEHIFVIRDGAVINAF